MTTLDSDALGVVVAAAGRSERLGVDKLFLPLGGRPVLSWSLRVFERCPRVARIALVVNEANRRRAELLIRRNGFAKVGALCLGGRRRQDSVLAGVRALAGCGWIAVHDGGRPFVTAEILERGLAAARTVGGAVAAVPAKDTIKEVGADDLIERTPPRARLWAAQTPQVFRADVLLRAYDALGDADVTDDAEVVERSGQPVVVFRGDYSNIKIATMEDVELARRLARTRGD